LAPATDRGGQKWLLGGELSQMRIAIAAFALLLAALAIPTAVEGGACECLQDPPKKARPVAFSWFYSSRQ
jgi:hypothetical protein